MKNKFNRFLKFSFLLTLLTSTPVNAQYRDESYLRDNWRFTRNDTPQFSEIEYDDTKWERISIPHDWAINGPFDKEIDKQMVAIEQNGEKVPTEKTGRSGSLPWIGAGWYRNTFEVSNRFSNYFIQFDGAMSEPVIYINGKKAGEWANGYNTFWIDITSYVSADKPNTIAVRLENLPESSRWYPGAGLYRPVRLIQTQLNAIKQWGVHITTPEVTQEYAHVKVATTLLEKSDKNSSLTIELLDPQGVKVASGSCTMLANHVGELQLEVKQPKLWSPETPSRYQAVIEVMVNGKVTDRKIEKFGIRHLAYSAEKGFQLNGISRKFKGVCLHHDLGPIGSALNKAALARQIHILKDMGCDAIRTAHNMPAPWQMELCDSLGMMVMAESFDMWRYPKCKNGYNRFFDAWAERDIENLILCHRNHPSIIMWCIGNEIPEQGSADGAKIARRLQDLCHKLDPTRPVTAGMDRVDAAIKSGFGAVLDVAGLNYRCHKYEEAYKALPQGYILGSETASTVSSRGVYKFPVVKKSDMTYEDGQCSSYDLEYCSWSNIPETDWVLQDDKDWVIGEFVWTGFDYLGEPTPYDTYWPSRSSYFGICDLAGLPKDRYYLYRSRWNTTNETIHLLPHWNWEGREGEITPVYCYTNHPTAELFVNGVSQGKRTKDDTKLEDRYRLRWNEVRYQPGVVKVVVYDANGKEAGSKEIRTAGKASNLTLTADRTTITADGEDLSYITVCAVDNKGHFCPTANNSLQVKVTGAGEFKGICNGDATSLELFTKPTMKLFNGQLVVVIQSKTTQGAIQVTLSGKGVKSQTITLQAQ